MSGFKTLLAKLGLARRPETRLAERFTTVYQDRSWGSDQSASGLGSERSSAQVTHSLDLLRRMIGELDIRSISDIPCGDFNWMPILLDERPELNYVGYDIVPPLILENQRRHPKRRFKVLDITTEVPPQADLIFSKDLLNHLSNDDVWAALTNMVASRSRYFMVSNNAGFENVELWDGVAHASRHLDLFAEPFNLPPAHYADHYMVVWEREAVAKRLREVGR